MKRLTLSTLALSGLALACDVPETGILATSVVANSGESMGGTIECSFEAGSDESPSQLVLDVGYSFNATYPINVLNALAEARVPFGEGDQAEIVRDPNEVQPLRADVRWECDSNGFSGGLGPLVIPAFDPNLPFCLDKRSEANEAFQGFDVVTASGALVSPGGEGIAFVNMVPWQMGRAIDEAFDIATFADSCCRDSTNCNGQNPGAPGCANLQQIFQALDPQGSNLQVASPDPTQPSDDLLRFRPFALFDGDYHISVDPKAAESSQGQSYPMRFRTVIELANAAGDLFTTNEFTQTVHFCRHCGFTLSPTTRDVNLDNHNICYNGVF